MNLLYTPLIITLLTIQTEVWSQSPANPYFYTSPKQVAQGNDTTLSTDIPRIIIKSSPSTLVWIDGAPVIVIDSVLRMYRILNTTHLIIKNHNDRKYYLNGIAGWYVSDSAEQGYKPAINLPPVIQLMDNIVNKRTPGIQKRAKQPDQIVVSQVPAVLMYTYGKPKWIAIAGTGLSYVQNSPFDILKDTLSQQVYITVSGRWFQSAGSLDGPWSFVPSDKLLPDFARIPANSPKAGVLRYVSGTGAAQSAVSLVKLPQKVFKLRGVDSAVRVHFDGGPEFASVMSGSELFVAQNSDLPAFSFRNTFYAISGGTWYTSTSPNGPWETSSTTPPDLDKLTVDQPFYHTKYAYITDTSREQIEGAFTGGYLNTFIQNNSIVYGTGVYYRPWTRKSFFLRPLTWSQGLYYEEQKGWQYRPRIRSYEPQNRSSVASVRQPAQAGATNAR